MLLQGEIDWVLALGLTASGLAVLAVMALAVAARARAAFQNATASLQRLERAASLGDKRLFQVLNAIPVALVETDLSGKFTFANRAAHQLLGRRDAELIGLRFHSATWGITYPDGRLIPPDLLPNARALRGQTVKGFQHVIANPGTRKKMLVSVTSMPILNEVGEVIGSTSALVEIESLAQPEPAPAPGDELTRRVFDAASSLLAIVTPEGALREVNRCAAEALGRTPLELAGQDFAELFTPPERRADVRAALAAAAGEPAVTDLFEESLLRADGERRFIRWKPLPLTSAEGQVDAVLLAGEDVTEAVDAPPAIKPEELEALREALAGRETALAEAEAGLRTAAEQRRALEQAGAEAAAALAASQARLAATEDALATAQRLETVGRLTGGVAHDFNNLLTVIIGALDMILRRADDADRVKRLGEAALAAGRRGERLTRQLLAFSRRQEFQHETLDLGVLLGGLEPIVRKAAPPAVTLTVEVDRQLGHARLDPVQFEAALLNLVSNAVDAVEQGGEVTIDAGPVVLMDGEVPDLEAGRYLRVTVGDTGSGMEAAVLARALEPFFTTKAVGRGAGLGLAQVYGFARQAGGAVQIRSTPGEGTEVSLFLPRAEAPEVPAAAPQAEPAPAPEPAPEAEPAEAEMPVAANEAGEAGDAPPEAAETPSKVTPFRRLDERG